MIYNAQHIINQVLHLFNRSYFSQGAEQQPFERGAACPVQLSLTRASVSDDDDDHDHDDDHDDNDDHDHDYDDYDNDFSHSDCHNFIVIS